MAANKLKYKRVKFSVAYFLNTGINIQSKTEMLAKVFFCAYV